MVENVSHQTLVLVCMALVDQCAKQVLECEIAQFSLFPFLCLLLLFSQLPFQPVFLSFLSSFLSSYLLPCLLSYLLSYQPYFIPSICRVKVKWSTFVYKGTSLYLYWIILSAIWAVLLRGLVRTTPLGSSVTTGGNQSTRRKPAMLGRVK